MEDPQLDLATLGQQALDDYKQDLATKTKAKIGLLVGRKTQCEGVIKRLERQLAKAKKSRDKAVTRLEAIMRGDWKALPRDDEKFSDPLDERDDLPKEE